LEKKAMNTKIIQQLTRLSFIIVAFLSMAMGATQKLTGIVSDDMCKQKHMMPGHSDADCTHACIKAGSHYALVSGDKVYVLKGDSKQIGQFAGKRVAVTGDVMKDSLTVQSISEEK
jgi:hypothetical protein